MTAPSDWIEALALGTLVLLAMPGAARAEGGARAVPVQAEVPAGERPGPRPYEVLWSGARNVPPPQVTFADLRGWTLEVSGPANVSLQASVAQHVWAERVAKFSYGGGQRAGATATVDQATGKAAESGPAAVGTTAWIRPPQPILIVGEFDALKLWGHGGYYRTTDGLGTDPPSLAVHLRDAADRAFEVSLGRVMTGNWSIEQGVLDRAQRAAARFPMRFEALEFSDCDLPGESCLYLESLTFYRAPRDPGRFKLPPLPAGFPISNNGMLPTPPPGVAVRIERRQDGVAFISHSPTGELRYEVRPAEGLLNGVSAQWGDGAVFRPMADGRLRLALPDGEKAPAAPGRVVSAEFQGEAFVVRWRMEAPGQAVAWQATYRPRGRTLVVEVACAGGVAEGLSLGEMAGLANPRGIFVPYLLLNRQSHIYADGPWIGCAAGLFVSVLPDVYHSDFSNLDHLGGVPAGDRLRLVGGTENLPLTDGRRNDLRDRILVTVSPEFADTLPNVPNPPSPHRARLAPYLFSLPYWPSLNYYATLKRYGVDRVIATSFNWHVQGYDQAGLIGSPSGRWRPRPEIGMERWQEYRRGTKALGYLFGTYSFVPCLNPVSEYWDEAGLGLRSDGSLARGWWYGEWALKFAAALPIIRQVGRKVREYYPADTTYLDISTLIAPMAHDYEAGVQGAGMGRATLLGNLACIAEARRWQGSVISEGYFRWLYAGI